MKLLYQEEHLSCFNYESGDSPSIENVRRLKGDVFNVFTDSNEIVFLIEGALRFSYGNFVNKQIKAGEFMLLPTKSHCAFKVEKDCSVLVFRINISFTFCDHFSLETLLRKEKAQQAVQNEPHFLKINERIKNFLSLTNKCINDGLRCSYYFDLKMKELLFLLRAFYTKEELQGLFAPIISKDIAFSDSIFKNHEKVKTVKEFSELLNYSLSGFEKRFKKVFGISAYQWMKMQKARRIYHEINCTQRTFMEISFEFGFSSSSHFNDFCKASFGATPGKIRKEGYAKLYNDSKPTRRSVYVD